MPTFLATNVGQRLIVHLLPYRSELCLCNRLAAPGALVACSVRSGESPHSGRRPDRLLVLWMPAELESARFSLLRA